MKELFKNRIIIDAVIVTLITLGAFLGLSALGLVHIFLFLIPVPIALFTIKYEDSKAIIPLSLIIALSGFILLPLTRHDAMMEGFVVLTITALVGVLHGYIAERHMSHLLRLTLIIIADVIANVLILAVFSKAIYGYTLAEEVAHFVEKIFVALEGLNLSQTLINLGHYYSRHILVAIVVATGVAEAIMTHVVVHALAKRVFKIEYGHTFTGITMLVPRVITFVFLPITILTYAFAPSFASLNGFFLVLHIIGMNILAIGFVFYVLDGYTLILRFFAVRFHRRAYLVSTLIMFLLAPLVFVLGLVDSLFRLQPRLQVRLRR